MAGVPSYFMFLLLALVLLAVGGRSSQFSPAFIWSNHRFNPPLEQQQQHRVHYKITSPQSVADAALDRLKVSRNQCSESCVDLLVSFTGGEVVSDDLPSELPSGAVSELKSIVSGSESSLAFPYVSTAPGRSFANELVSALHEKNHLFQESFALGCPGSEPSFSKLDSVEELSSRKASGTPQLLLVCLSPASAGATIKSVQSKLDEAGVGYLALYSPDPFPGTNRLAPKHRLLASINDTSSGNGSSSANGTKPYCDEVCQNKSTLLEAIFVAIVLLIILISGLCCMMGIQTPLRFEKPHES